MEPSTAQLLGTITQTGGILVACWKVTSEIDAWRREYLGKRRTDLAEEVLVTFHEIREALLRVRYPAYPAKMLETLHTPREAARHMAEVTQERLEQHEAILKKFEALKFRFLAHFPEDKALPFSTVADIVTAMKTSCLLLLKTNDNLSAEALNTFRTTILQPDTDEAAAADHLPIRLKTAQEQLLTVLSPHMVESKGLYRLLTARLSLPFKRSAKPPIV